MIGRDDLAFGKPLKFIPLQTESTPKKYSRL